MSHYADVLLEELSQEGVEKTSDNTAPVPQEDDEVIGVKLKDDNHEKTYVDSIMKELINTNPTAGALSIESYDFHDPENVRYLGAERNSEDNFVVNGVYIPDLMASDTADFKVVRLTDTSTNVAFRELEELRESTLIYVMIDEGGTELVRHLKDRGFYAAETPLEAAKEIERLRNSFHEESNLD